MNGSRGVRSFRWMRPARSEWRPGDAAVEEMLKERFLGSFEGAIAEPQWRTTAIGRTGYLGQLQVQASLGEEQS